MTVKISGIRAIREISGPAADEGRPPVTANTNLAMPAPARRYIANPMIRRRGTRGSSPSRFFSILSDDQLRACELIVLGFHLRTAGIGMRTQSFAWQPPSTGNRQDREIEVMQRFTRWAVAVQRNGLSLSAVLDIVVFGKSCRTVDRERRKRNGFARENLLKSLGFYGEL